jgi:transposase
MRGPVSGQEALWPDSAPDARGPADHPIRLIKQQAEAARRALDRTFDELDRPVGRPSMPPERLLKAQRLIARSSVRSDRLCCERLDYDSLFRWFLDMNLDEPSWDHSPVSANRDRRLAPEGGRRFFDAVVDQARRAGLLSDEPCTVDGQLIEAWASLKSLKPTDAATPATPPADPGNPTVDVPGERRSNATHQSPTDPEARLLRKGRGKKATLGCSGHVLMEHRHGLCVDLPSAPATGTAERDTAGSMRRRQARRGMRPRTLAADKGYHCRAFVRWLRRRRIRPHLARVTGRHTPGLDGRPTRPAGYALSQRLRKRVEEIIGWIKTTGGLRQTRFRGVARTPRAGDLVGAADHRLRLSRVLRPQPASSSRLGGADTMRPGPQHHRHPLRSRPQAWFHIATGRSNDSIQDFSTSC